VWGLSSWIPPILPRRKLEQEILNIFTADLLLKSEASVDSMSDEDIGQVRTFLLYVHTVVVLSHVAVKCFIQTLHTQDFGVERASTANLSNPTLSGA
jgi:hypothetical protein